MAPPPGQSGSQPLPQKEQALLKKIVKCYEQKQYKYGLKFAKQILSNTKFAEHGETLAMKGLILNQMPGKMEEAREFVKRGLKNDVKSHVCWHVYGLVQRSEKKYDDAIKAYRNALRIDKDNMQILRDLSLLQIQMRDLEGYRDTRYQLLVLRPTQRASWIGYAMAYHFLGQYDMALKIIDEFKKTQTPSPLDFEFSELLIYQNMVLREAGKLSEAAVHLRQNDSHICDRLQVLEIKGELHTAQGEFGPAAAVYRDLIKRNSEATHYYKSFEVVMELEGYDEETIEKKRLLYAELEVEHPRASAPMRIPLNFLTGGKFKDHSRRFLLSGLRKGLPALFQQLRVVYCDQEKVRTIEQILLPYQTALENNGRLPEDPAEGPLEPPTTLLWLYHYLAQHYDKKGDMELALHYIDKALDHTPTLIELLLVKAKIYKHSGNKAMAVRFLEEAQGLDTADRYINSKCAKYMLRAGLIQEAEDMCAKFTREGVSATQSLNEMQCMWFESECAEAYRKLGRLGEALKKCHEIERHFSDIMEDQFDFHTYCVRKMTLCSYVRLLRMEDGLRRHRFYFRAAKCAIKIYLRLFDNPDDFELGGEGGKGEKAMTSEKRKAMRKKKKQAAKEQQEQQKNTQTNSRPQPKDPDLDHTTQEPFNPNSLLKTEKPLDEAVKFLLPLIELHSQEMEAYLLGFQVYLRREKVLPMLQCLKRAGNLNPNHPQLFNCRGIFLKFVEEHPVDGVVKEILDEEVDFWACEVGMEPKVNGNCGEE